MRLSYGQRCLSVAAVAVLAACGNMGDKPKMPTSASVVMASVAPSSAAKVFEGSLAAAKAAGFEEIGTLQREKVSATCWSDEKCVLDNIAQCPPRVLKPWLQDGLLAAAQRGRASAVLVDSEWSLSLQSDSKPGKCRATVRGSDRYVQVCTTNSRGLSECRSTVQPTWDCIDRAYISGRQCVERSHAILLTDDHAAVAFLRVVAAADARYRAVELGSIEKLGYIDRSGRFVIAPQYDFAAHFSQGRAVVGQKIEGKWPINACWYHLIDKRGQPHLSQQCPSAGQFDSGLLPGWWSKGYLGLDGTTRLPAIPRKSINDFSEGLAAVDDIDTDSCGYIDTTGVFVIPPGRFYNCSAFKEGRATVTLSPTRATHGLLGIKVNSPPKGYIDRTGEVKLPAVYEVAGAYSEGWAFVVNQGQPGFINLAGDVVLPLPEWSRENDLVAAILQIQIRPEFHEGLARMSDKPGRVGFIDRTGRFVIAPLFSDAREFRDGLAPAAVTTASGVVLWGYIRKDGSWAIEPQFSDADAFHDGLAMAGTWVKQR